MSVLVVCAQKHVDDQMAAHQPDRLISVLHPGQEIDTPASLPPARHYRIEFDDVVIERQGHQAVRPEDLRALLDWTAGWDGTHPCLVHCRHGIGRSVAIGYLILCQRNPGREEEVARMVRRIAPFAAPNSKVIRLGAELLDRPLIGNGVRIMSVPAGGLPGPVVFPAAMPPKPDPAELLFPGG